MKTVSCAGCDKKVPVTDNWPDGWFGVGADGSLLYPTPAGAHVVVANLPAADKNEAVCSEACLRVVRERRVAAATRQSSPSA